MCLAERSSCGVPLPDITSSRMVLLPGCSVLCAPLGIGWNYCNRRPSCATRPSLAHHQLIAIDAVANVRCRR